MMRGYRGPAAALAATAVAAGLGYGAAERLRAPAPPLPLCAEDALLCPLQRRNLELAQEIGGLLAERGCLLATAESVTAGELAAAFGRTKWAGLVLAGGVVAYDAAVKAALLGVRVDPALPPSEAGERMIAASVAREMADGLAGHAERVNAWRDEAGRRRRICVAVALTGAATTWRGPPRLFVGVRMDDGPAEVARFALRDDLAGRPEERLVNIQLAVSHALELLRARLAER